MPALSNSHRLPLCLYIILQALAQLLGAVGRFAYHWLPKPHSSETFLRFVGCFTIFERLILIVELSLLSAWHVTRVVLRKACVESRLGLGLEAIQSLQELRD